MCELAKIALPQSVLETLMCCECEGLLSTGPVKVKPNGDSVCGKCIYNVSPATPLFEHKAFNQIINALTFPCKYQNRGCDEQLPFNDSSDHEHTCDFRLHACLSGSSACKWTGAVTQMPEHYRIFHEELYMTQPTFKLELDCDNEEVRVFLKRRALFLIVFRHYKRNVQIFVTCFQQLFQDAAYTLTLHTGNENHYRITARSLQTKPFTRSMLTATAGSYRIKTDDLLAALDFPRRIFCNVSLNLPEQLFKTLGWHLHEIKCPHCSVYMAPPIYSCDNNHVTCADCIGYTDTCTGCEQDACRLTRRMDLERIATSNFFVCRWQNCTYTYGSSDVRRHEQRCRNKVYQCPLCQNWGGTYGQIKGHFDCAHGGHPLRKHREVTIDGVVSQYDFCVLAFGEIFRWELSPGRRTRRSVCVTYSGSPSFCADFEYHVELRHSHNPQFVGNKVYVLKNYSVMGSRITFKQTIPNDDILVFGDLAYYNIVFRIVKVN